VASSGCDGATSTGARAWNGDAASVVAAVALGSAAWVGVANGARAGVVAAAEARRGPVGRGASGLLLRQRSAARPERRLGGGQHSAGTGAAAARHGATGGGVPELGERESTARQEGSKREKVLGFDFFLSVTLFKNYFEI
jgi:hypothetical protein